LHSRASRWVLDISRDGDFATSLGSLFKQREGEPPSLQGIIGHGGTLLVRVHPVGHWVTEVLLCRVFVYSFFPCDSVACLSCFFADSCWWKCNQCQPLFPEPSVGVVSELSSPMVKNGVGTAAHLPPGAGALEMTTAEGVLLLAAGT